MKRLLIPIFAGLVLFSGAIAQRKSHRWAILFGGPTFVTSSPDLPKLWNGVFNVGIGYGFGSSENGYWRASLRFGELTLNQEKFLESLTLNPNRYSVNGGTRTTFSAILQAVYSPFNDSTGFPIYLAAGLGYFLLGSTTMEVTNNGFRLIAEKSSQSGLLIDAGIGFRHRIVRRLMAYVEIAYSLGATSNRNTVCVPLCLGLTAEL